MAQNSVITFIYLKPSALGYSRIIRYIYNVRGVFNRQGRMQDLRVGCVTEMYLII